MKNIPFVPGMFPGIGCNILTGRLSDTPFQQVDLYSPKGATGQTVEFGLSTVKSTRDLSKKLNFDASVSLTAVELFSNASAAARLLNKFTTSAHRIYLLVSVVVTHSHEVITNFTLKPEVSSLLEDQTLNQFRASYGNGFIAGFIKGGCYYGLIEIQTDSLEEKRELAGKLDVKSLAAGSARLDAERYLTEAISDKKTQISIFRSGGLSESTGVTLEEMLQEASTFPSSVAENPSIVFAIYRDYNDIPPFSQLNYSLQQKYQEYVQCVEYLEDLYLQYRDHENMLRSFVTSPSSIAIISSETTNNLQLALKADLDGISAQMKIIKSLIRNCHETATSCAKPMSLYQLSPEIKNILDSWIDASERVMQNEVANQAIENKKTTADKPYYNVAVVGITGVGKSSLVNYLFGEKVAATGLGRPVTKRGFESYEFLIENLPVKLFDSWGLEIDRVSEWMENLNEELSRRGTDRPAEEWFHTILYCINAAGSRHQDRDIRIIKRFLESKYQVVIILTKADSISEEEEAEFAHKIRQDIGVDLPVIAACSESRKGRRGVTINAFGKEEIEAQIYDNFWDTITARLPQRCRRVVEGYLDNWESEQIERIQENSKAGNNLDEIKEDLCRSWDDTVIERIVREEINRTMYVYGQISATIDYRSGNQRPSLEDPAKKYSAYDFEKIANALSGLSTTVAVTVLSNVLSGSLLGLGGPIALALVPIVSKISISLFTQMNRDRTVNNLIETVKVETAELRGGLGDLERGIEESLNNLRMLSSSSSNDHHTVTPN